MRHSRLACILIAVPLLLGGCGTTTATSSTSNGAVSTTRSGSSLCSHVTTINQALTQLSNIGDKTTVGEVKAIQQKLTTALGLLSKLPNGGGSALKNVETVNHQLAAAIRDKPDGATLGQTSAQLQSLKGKVAQAQGGVTKLASLLKCSS